MHQIFIQKNLRKVAFWGFSPKFVSFENTIYTANKLLLEERDT